MYRYAPTLVLLVLAGVGSLVAPRLTAPKATVREVAPLAAPAGPCFRWGALQCCYVDDNKDFDWDAPACDESR
jgi:hypothetical protein